MSQPFYEETVDGVTRRVRSERRLGEGWIVLEREISGVTHAVGFRAADVVQLCSAIMKAAVAAKAPSDREDADRAHQLLGMSGARR